MIVRGILWVVILLMAAMGVVVFLSTFLIEKALLFVGDVIERDMENDL